MITLKSINLKNFLSHQDTKITFEENDHLSIEGKSGSGKSSIIEALIWGLYGKARSDSRSIIKRGTTVASVRIELGGDKTYLIDRCINLQGKQELKVLENDRVIPTTGLRDTQEYLEKNILHSSYLLFINSIVYPQENTESFVKQPANKRKDIIMEIINASVYDGYYKKTKDKLTELHDIKLKEEERIHYLQEMLGKNHNYAKQVDDLTTETILLAKQTETINKEIEETREKKMSLQNNILIIAEKKKNLSEIILKIIDIDIESNKLNGLKEELSRMDDNENELNILRREEEMFNQWQSKRLELIEKRPTLKNFDIEISEIEGRIVELTNKKIDLCPEINKECPIIVKENTNLLNEEKKRLTKKMIEREKYNKELKEWKSEESKLGTPPHLVNKKRMQELETVIKDKLNIQSRILEIEALNKEYINLTKKRSELEDEIKKRNDVGILKEIQEMDSQILNLKFKLNSVQKEYVAAMQSLSVANEAKRMIEEYEKELIDLNKKNSTTSKEVESLELLKDAFGTNGIKSIVIDFVIPRLEEKINNVLGKLSDFRVQLDTQKKGVGEDTTLEGLFINIYNESGEQFSYESYSGGEKLKITVAISEALSEIQNIGFRILDELFIGLDEESTEKFTEVMTTLQNRFNQLICISHLRNIKDMFDKKILINKINGTSHIINN